MLRVSGVSSVSLATLSPDPALRVRDLDSTSRDARRGEQSPLSHLMSQHLAHARPRTDAEALRLLRLAFPAAPLAARVAAMAERARTA